MTCRMAAGQRRKQLTNSNHHELYKGRKKKRLESSDYILHLRSQVDLEWDVSQKRVVAKKEQIGVSWTDMAPFVESYPKSHSGVADVFSVPHDIFDLNNLSEVLTYEVWATCLSESERELLLQFLPSEIDTKQAVSSLLKGENHHFGNPCLKWSSLLCTGNLHPDVILCAEQQFRSNIRAYYHEINKYHTGILEVLKKWRTRWLSCNDPEKLWSEGFTENKKGKLTVSAEKPKSPNLSKREMQSSAIICDSDVVKYMAYIKITRSQLQTLKNLKHSGDGIQPKSLSHVLGDINCFHVHPYETVEEEEKKLHEHWMELARKDVLAAYEEYQRRKLLKEQCWKSLEQNLVEKSKLLMDQDEETESSDGSSEVSACTGDFDHHKHVSDTDDEKDDLMHSAISDRDTDHIHFYSPNGKTDEMLVDDEAVEEDDALKQEVDLLPMSESLYNQNDNMMLEGSLSSVKDMWQPTSLHVSNYHSSQGLNYSSADQSSLRDKQVNNRHPAHLLGLERDFTESESGEPVGPDFNRTSLSPFANQNHNEMLPIFSKGSALLPSYAQEDMNSLQPPALHHSLMAFESLTCSGQFASQFQGQPQLLQQREIWEKGPYMDQSLPQNVYSANSYPSKGHHLSQVDRQVSAIQCSENSSAVGYNWFPTENPAYSNWSRVETLSSRHGIGGWVNANGNLPSVFAAFDARTSEQYGQVRNFVGGVMPNAESVYSYTRTQLGSTGNQGFSAAPSLTNVSWRDIPNQNPDHNHNPGGRHF